MNSRPNAYARWAAGVFDRFGAGYRGVLGICLNHRCARFVGGHGALRAFVDSSKDAAQGIPCLSRTRGLFWSACRRRCTPRLSSLKGKLAADGNGHPEASGDRSLLQRDRRLHQRHRRGGRCGYRRPGEYSAHLRDDESQNRSAASASSRSWTNCARSWTQIPDMTAVPQDLASHDFVAGRGFPIEINLRGIDYRTSWNKNPPRSSTR